LCSNCIPQRTTVPMIYDGADEVVEKKRRSFVFHVPISIYNLLILDSLCSLFHNYRIWPWPGKALCKSLHKKPAEHFRFLTTGFPSEPFGYQTSLSMKGTLLFTTSSRRSSPFGVEIMSRRLRNVMEDSPCYC